MIYKNYYLTQNPAYTDNIPIGTVCGVIIHDTAAGNPYLRRCIQPDDGFLGINRYNNSWNDPTLNKMVHLFVGKDKDETVRVYCTLPFDRCCYGCGKGSTGESYNYPPHAYIQMEIMDDGYVDKAYFFDAFTSAAECTAMLCTQFNLPLDRVIGHYEAHEEGYATDHSDPKKWLTKFGYNMDDFRNWVYRAQNNIVPVIPENTIEAEEAEEEPTSSQGILALKKRIFIMRANDLMRIPGHPRHYHSGRPTTGIILEGVEDDA